MQFTPDADSDSLDDHITLAIGCFASICRDRLADRLVAFARAAPANDLGVHEMARAALLPALREGRLTLAVMPHEPAPDLRSMVLWEDQVAVAMPADHPLAAAPVIPADALAKAHFLISRQQHGVGMHSFLAARVHPFAGPSGALCDLNLSHLLDRVALGEGFALLTASHAAQSDPGVAVRRVAGPRSRFPVLAYWRDVEPAPALATLLTALREPA